MNVLAPLNYFTSPNFLRADLQAGVLRSRGGTRLVGLSADFLRGFVRACEHEAGAATPVILRRCGLFYGGRLARRIEGELNAHLTAPLRDCLMLEFDGLLKDLWCGLGMGELEVGWPCGQRGFLPVTLVNSPLQDIGPSGHVADDTFCGLLEGFFGHFATDGLTCLQTGDLRLGDKAGTTFILAVPDVLPRLQSLIRSKTAHAAIVSQLDT